MAEICLTLAVTAIPRNFMRKLAPKGNGGSHKGAKYAQPRLRHRRGILKKDNY